MKIKSVREREDFRRLVKETANFVTQGSELFKQRDYGHSQGDMAVIQSGASSLREPTARELKSPRTQHLDMGQAVFSVF